MLRRNLRDKCLLLYMYYVCTSINSHRHRICIMVSYYRNDTIYNILNNLSFKRKLHRPILFLTFQEVFFIFCELNGKIPY